MFGHHQTFTNVRWLIACWDIQHKTSKRRQQDDGKKREESKNALALLVVSGWRVGILNTTEGRNIAYRKTINKLSMNPRRKLCSLVRSTCPFFMQSYWTNERYKALLSFIKHKFYNGQKMPWASLLFQEPKPSLQLQLSTKCRFNHTPIHQEWLAVWGG